MATISEFMSVCKFASMSASWLYLAFLLTHNQQRIQVFQQRKQTLRRFLVMESSKAIQEEREKVIEAYQYMSGTTWETVAST